MDDDCCCDDGIRKIIAIIFYGQYHVKNLILIEIIKGEIIEQMTCR